ncbi:NAD(P)-dependent oxidoreductase [Paramixta manurensis]|uniref:NAD(P)-dependent oxidoreductase n=1 Tax=Paramixta manurensis TaxID=2740817 RepID=A0A6M8UD26_9GAMM|nr:NAD(P)-dependent oxidoreductase [Erwiniaceae bacterium PD-1]
MKIGMIGLGQMGWHMAKNLAAAGYTVLGFDPRPDSEARMAEAGGTVRTSPAAVAAEAEVTVLMVLNTQQADSAIWGEQGFASGARPDSTLIVMSSLSPVYVRQLAERSAGKFALLDAPVSGGVEGARAASLTIMASGPAALQEKWRPVLQAMGKNVVNVGLQAGLGATMKTINQAMYFCALASASEMVVAGVKAGLDPDTIVQVVSTSSGGSWALAHRVPLAWQTNYVSGATLAIAGKDLRSALELATELQTSSEITQLVFRIIDEGLARHNQLGDDPLVVELLEHLSHYSIRDALHQRTGQ